MAEHTEKLVIGLLVMSVVLTLTTMVVIFSNEGVTYNLLSGAATSTGTGETNLTITSTTSLTNQNNQINFGSGRVNSTCNFAEITSDGTFVNLFANGSNSTGSGQVCPVSFTVPTSGFLLENTGNVNVSLGYVCTGNCTHALFISGARAPGMSGLSFKATPNLQAGQSGEEGTLDTLSACQGGGALFRDSGVNVTNETSYVNSTNVGLDLGNPGVHLKSGQVSNSTVALSRTGHWLCGNSSNYPLNADNSRDAIVVDFNVTVPADAPGTGTRSSLTMTFNATSAG